MIQRIEIPEGQQKLLNNFLEDMTTYLNAFERIMGYTKKGIGNFNVCESQEGCSKVQVMSAVWVQMANVVKPDIANIEGQYDDEPEFWDTHIFKCTLQYRGTEYFCFMRGKEIDELGIPIDNKKTLCHGGTQSL